MEKQISEINANIRGMFPDAVAVRILVTADEIQVNPEYNTDTTYSMRRIDGKWVTRQCEK